ncbi:MULTISPECIES: cysteine desulfurase-like protein [Bhargavaea]|uniref:Cysteine desulfurase-like protein n=1 Tax=Bhargavaea changchunensis TaxID=2134037 RepID=A0ABW2NEY1_9BACL|nr:cysteine desulfurase-like protein [Bhargavaea sp. CC-171006]
MSAYPIDEIRKQFPALGRTYHGKPVVFLDGPGGSQVVKGAMDAMVAYMTSGNANLHGQFPTSRETEAMIQESREAVADLVNAQPSEVAFGQNATSLAFSIARALSRDWKPGDEIVLTEMDHPANIDPWLSAAEDKGVKVNWIPVDSETLTLDLSDLDGLIHSGTRLVAVTLASNAVGTIPDIRPIIKKAREAGALTAVDAVHAVPHFAIDREQLDADFLLFSAYKFFGPHIGMAVIRSSVFKDLKPYKVAPSDAHYPDNLQTGTQNFAGIAGVKASIAFIESLGNGETRRERILDGYRRIEEHENALAAKIRRELAAIDGIRLYQAPETVAKTPTFAFTVEGLSPAEFSRRMAEVHSIFVADGHFYATRLAERAGVHESGCWIRAGLAPYNTEFEIDRFLDATREIVRTPALQAGGRA